MAWGRRKRKFKAGDKVIVKKYKERYGHTECCGNHPAVEICRTCDAFNGKPVKIHRIRYDGYYELGGHNAGCNNQVHNSMLMLVPTRVWRKL